MNYLASLGLCVPGREASLFLLTIYILILDVKRLHMQLTENFRMTFVRIHDILMQATGKSIIIVNEILHLQH